MEHDSSSELRPVSIRSAGPESFAERVFVLDVHLGKLAVFLRLAGFPAVYSTTCSSDNLIELSHRNGHVLLTRSRGLLKHREVETGLLIQSKDAAEQLKEVIRRFQLLSHVSILSICPKCSKKLNPVSKQHILEQLEPGTIKRYQDFYQCSGCRQIFWKGSHYPAFIRMLDTFRAELLNESS